ncbi:MAG: ADP-ribosylglycohydrolase family protein [Anaerolineae bacterium]|nr:ADP-ribosylglycohydrolase family protein [Anaerolineae bacterium]
MPTYDDAKLKKKILGGLYGQALGDAFGMPAYFHPDRTAEVFGWIDRFLPAPDDHHVHSGLPAGRITDDSEQAFSMAQAYIKYGGVTLDAAVEGIVTWYDRVDGDNSPYVGPSTKRGVSALKKGADPTTTGLWGDTNGAPMRISPVGLLHPNDPVGAVDDAVIAATPTHFTRPAVAGASAVAAAIAVGMGEDVSIEAVIAAGLLGARLGEKRAPLWLGPSCASRIEMAVEIANSSASVEKRLRRLYDEIGTSLSVPETVGSAFGCFVMADGDPQKTAEYATNLSGDADTVAAIACAIAGTWAGYDAIPNTLIEQLNADEIFVAYDVPAIADGLLNLIISRG